MKPHRQRLLPAAMKLSKHLRDNQGQSAVQAATLPCFRGTDNREPVQVISPSVRHVEQVNSVPTAGVGSEIVTAVSLGPFPSSFVPSAESTPAFNGATWFFAVPGISSFL